MAKANGLTEFQVKNAKAAPAGQRRFIADPLLPGFGLRVTDKGAKSFVVVRRCGTSGPVLKLAVGDAAVMKLADAREKARDWLLKLKAGIDPRAVEAAAVAAERERRLAEARKRANTVASVVDQFIALYAKKHQRDEGTATRATLDRYVIPAWGTRDVTEIILRDVHDLLDPVAARKVENSDKDRKLGGPVMANRVHAALTKLFNWSVGRGILERSPIPPRMEKPGGKEKARERVLTDAELNAVWRAAGQIGTPFGAAVRLMILTGQRRDEVGEMKWSEIDADKALWTLPGSRTKNGIENLIHLSTAALEIIEAMPRYKDCPYVFTTNGLTPISGWSRALAGAKGLRKLSGVKDFTYHDLRRTMTTGMANLGIAPHVADKILNHKSGAASRGVAGIYNRGQYLAERKQALDAWAAKIERLINPPADNVVSIAEARAS